MSGVVRMVHQPVLQQESNLCVCGSPAEHLVHGLPDDVVSIDIAAELRSWCIDAHLPSGASECLFCEAALAVELYREELYQLARLATAGWEGQASGRDRDVQLYVGRLAHRHRQDRMGARLRPLVTWPMVATRTDVAVVDDQRRVMCGDRVLADQWTGVVAAQHGPFSWVVIDGISVPQTHATIALRPVDNDHAE